VHRDLDGVTEIDRCRRFLCPEQAEEAIDEVST